MEADLPPPEPPKGTADSSENGRDWHDIASLFVWGFTLLAAVAAAFFTGRQAYLANKQLRVGRDVLSVTRDTEKRQLRAYGFINNGYITLNGRIITAVVEAKNTGQTPAYDFMMNGRMRVGRGQTVINTSTTQEVSHGLLGPGNTFTWQVDIDVPVTDTVTIPAVENAPSLITVFGQAQYKDAFDRSWCLTFQLRSGRYGNSTWPLTLAEHGNEEKEKECPNWPPPA